ncbi:MAG: DUF4258 domain-containing protein [Phycisphaerae bacterium]|nr:DUF4258 domain-containing protein [Phycisphaerae bacterium]
MLEDIRSKILRRQYEFSRHAVDQTIIRSISVTEVEEALSAESEVIEDYHEDKYGPSCLILGFTKTGRALHMQCSYPSRSLVKIITLYEPAPHLWTDFRVRKRSE